MSNIALQLYTMRKEAEKDLPGMLQRVRDMGWEYVQWSGMPPLPADQIHAHLDKAGLHVVSAHCPMEPFEQDFDTALCFWKTVGVRFLGPGGMMKDCQDSLNAWSRGAQRLDAIGSKLYEAGIGLTYHNHTSEFEKFEGDPRCKLDMLMEKTRPESLRAELDLAWIHAAGASPAAYIRKYPNRCPIIHAKDIAPDFKDHDVTFKPLGEGCLDWPAIFAAGKDANIEWYVYEQDVCDDAFACAEKSLAFLKKHVLEAEK